MNFLSRFRLPASPLKLIESFVFTLILTACTSMMQFVLQGGEESKQHLIRAHRPGPYILIFALDGVGHDQMMEALQSGATPWLSTLLGARQRNGVFEHAYSVSNAVSILPSTTIPGWSSIFTGKGPAYNGISGNEFFVRETMQFLAPIPVSVEETDDVRRAISEDLVGKVLKRPTLFDTLNGPAFVSLNYVHRGADLFTADAPEVIAALTLAFKAGKLVNSIQILQESYAGLDRNSVPKVIDAIQNHGAPTVQVVYFPGIDLYTHLAENSLHAQVSYLQGTTFPLIESVLGEYRRQGVLNDTYVLFISDHGHTPVSMDTRHALATEPEMKAQGLLQSLGFRVRPSHLDVADEQSDYQAVLAYQGAMAYVYLADRSTCRVPGQKCDWSKPPRFAEDVMPVVHAFADANHGDGRFPKLKDTLDLIFAREPVPIAEDTHEYQIYDGSRLLPVSRYLAQHPRSDLIQLERRMRWLSAGPYGHRAGDVLLLAKSGLGRPITDRYYFSTPYFSQHGGASAQDSHITFMIARQNVAGEAIQKAVDGIIGDEPSQLDVVPLIRRLLMQPQNGVAQ